MRPRILFMGTPDPSAVVLRALAEAANIVAVITQPDRPKGRPKALAPSPVKLAALELDLPVHTPATNTALNDILSDLSPPDLGVVVAYGMILDTFALGVPMRGMVNLHFSLLPRWRGAAPVERAMLSGDSETGISLMQMDKGLDTGNILKSQIVEIGSATAGELTDVLALRGARLLCSSLDDLVAGRIDGTLQDRAVVTYAPKLTTGEAALDFCAASEKVVRQIKAYDPRPGAYAFRGNDRFKFWRVRVSDQEPGYACGDIVASSDAVLVRTESGSVELLELQPPNRARMSAAAWVRGQRGPLGRFLPKPGAELSE